MFRRSVILVAFVALGAALCVPSFALDALRGSGVNDLIGQPPGTVRPACVVPCICDDGLSCTTDPCLPDGGCGPVTINPGYCVIAGACVTEGTSSPANSCLSCNPQVSQTEFTARAGACDDNNACSTGDQCSGDICYGGPPTCCNDHDLCTTDSCCPATGCVYTPKDCSDAIACNVNSCDSATGACVHSKKAPQLVYIGPGVALRGKPIVLSARLTENGSTPVGAGRTVTFKVVSQICIGATDANGVARCTLVMNQTPGAKSVSFSFVGDTCYQAATRTDMLWVQ